MKSFVDFAYTYYRGRSGFYPWELPDKADREKMTKISFEMLAQDIIYQDEEWW